MEIPFYYSFKEFENNYKPDFKNWLKIYDEATEEDFLFELKNLYEPFVKWSGIYRFKDGIEISFIGEAGYPENAIASLIDEGEMAYSYQELVERKIKSQYVQFIDDLDGESFLPYWDKCNYRTNADSVLFDDKKHKYLQFFLMIILDYGSIK